VGLPFVTSDRWTRWPTKRASLAESNAKGQRSVYAHPSIGLG